MLDEELQKILACPLCKSSVKEKENKLYCQQSECGCIYRIEDEIPVMLIEEAERPCPSCEEEREWKADEEALICPNCKTEFQPSNSET